MEKQTITVRTSRISRTLRVRMIRAMKTRDELGLCDLRANDEKTTVEYPVRYKIQRNMSCFIFVHYLLAKKRKTDSKNSRYFHPALENSRLQLRESTESRCLATYFFLGSFIQVFKRKEILKKTYDVDKLFRRICSCQKRFFFFQLIYVHFVIFLFL